MNPSLEDLFNICQERTETMFHLYLNQPAYPDSKLQQATAYAVQNGGKRIRPLLVYATGLALDAELKNLDAPACAIELIHAYSLIHDDLPAMDNADLRRGKPSCHKAFSEALAILAGDALQPLAFEILASHPSELNSKQRLAMIKILSKAAGINGMAAGQALDLAGVNSIETLNTMYQLKTGALLNASVKLGAAASHHTETELLHGLETYIESIGLAFQIQDDLLDVQGDTQTTGKPPGLDSINNKITYPSILGIEKTQETIHLLFKTALNSISVLNEKSILLKELAYYLMERRK